MDLLQLLARLRAALRAAAEAAARRIAAAAASDAESAVSGAEHDALASRACRLMMRRSSLAAVTIAVTIVYLLFVSLPESHRLGRVREVRSRLCTP